ncbi:MAG: hypothetical protein OEN01_13050 [Candidatus Krumholzibacteria bacterium]|nr:hypothetical protein [Candidatus Krumholzibacteria bacterium]
MRRTISFIPLLMLLMATGFGCSGDSVEPADDQAVRSGVVSGEVGGADFELTFGQAGDPARPLAGPFVLRGRNIHHDPDLGALVVDLSVVNRSRTAFPEPVSLRFLSFLPESAIVLNPTNEVLGPGAAMVFEFDNDDGMWTPGEESLPVETHFRAGEGVSVGFTARLDVGESPMGGTIGGIVWNDLDEDGHIDDDEPGIGGAKVFLYSDAPDSMRVAMPVRMWETMTARDGTYRFDGLAAGHYQLVKPQADRWRPTTEPVIQVLLVETDDGVSDFLLGNFGCVLRRGTDEIAVGDYVEANGTYMPDPHRLMAQGIEVRHCRMDSMNVAVLNDCDDDYADYDCPCWYRIGKLRGPVTAVDFESPVVQVMGTDVEIVDEHAARPWGLSLSDVRPGDRVSVRVMRAEDGHLVGFMLREWGGTHEQVHGRVDALIRDNGHVVGLEVLDTVILLPRPKDEG